MLVTFLTVHFVEFSDFHTERLLTLGSSPVVYDICKTRKVCRTHSRLLSGEKAEVLSFAFHRIPVGEAVWIWRAEGQCPVHLHKLQSGWPPMFSHNNHSQTKGVQTRVSQLKICYIDFAITNSLNAFQTSPPAPFAHRTKQTAQKLTSPYGKPMAEIKGSQAALVVKASSSSLPKLK